MSVVAVGAMVLSLWWYKESSLDTGFHLAYGRHFLDTGEIVTFDPFLDPAIVRPFVNGNWGTQVIMAAVERTWGVTGLTVLRWALLSIVFGTISVIVRRHTSGWHWLAWVWMVVAVTAYERFMVRPELFGYAIMTLMLAVLLRGPESWRGVALLGGLQAAWTNLSYYYLVGLMLTASFLAGALVSKATVRRSELETNSSPDPWRLAQALAVQAAACFFNPWHVRGVLHPFQTLRFLHEQKVVGMETDQTGGGSWSLITELQQPFSFFGDLAHYRTIEAYFVLLAIVLVGLFALFARRRWGAAIAVFVFVVMSLQMRRNIAQFAFVAAPLSVYGFAAANPKSRTLRLFARWVRRGAVLTTIFAAVGWTWSIVDGRFYFVERRISREPGIGYSARFFPIEAAKWLSSQTAIGPRLYVDFFTSSNVLPWLDRRFTPLVNTNTFVYDDEWFGQIMNVGAGRMDYWPFFMQHRVDVALLHFAPDTEPLVRALHADSAVWALVYFDPHMVIFLRRTPAHDAVIQAHQPRAEDVDVEAWINETGGLRYHRALGLATKAAAPWAMGWYAPAARLLEEALALAPDSTPAWNYLGLCHGRLAEAAVREGRIEPARGHVQRAVQSFERALAIQPDDKALRNNFSKAQEMLHSLNEKAAGSGGGPAQ